MSNAIFFFKSDVTEKLITVSTYFSTLQNAVNATSNFLKDLKEDQIGKNEINVLIATQELEKFAINYGKIHSKANEGTVISQALYGESLVNAPIFIPFVPDWRNWLKSSAKFRQLATSPLLI